MHVHDSIVRYARLRDATFSTLYWMGEIKTIMSGQSSWSMMNSSGRSAYLPTSRHQSLFQRRPNLGFSFIYDLAHAHRLNKLSFEIMRKFQRAIDSITVTTVTRYHSSACSLTRWRAADSWQSARCQCLLLMPLSVMNLFRTYAVRPCEVC